MKKLLLITGAIVFIGNITGQRTQEDLVSIIEFDQSFLNKEVQTFPRYGCCMCGLGYHSILESPEINKMIDEMYMTRIEEVGVIIGGIPDDIFRPTEEYVIKDDVNKSAPESLVTISKNDIQRIPSMTGEADISKNLKLDVPASVVIDHHTTTYSACNCSNCSKTITNTEIIRNSIVKGGVYGTNGALEYVYIVVKKSGDNNALFTGSMSDAYGVFMLSLSPGDYELSFKSIGYAEKRKMISVQQNKDLDIGSVYLNDEPVKMSVCSFRRIKSEAEAESVSEEEDAQKSQGPFTGLEGHNFIEDPAIIYPNPVKDILNVKSTDPITVIEILGITGQVEMELDSRSTMDVSGLAAGTYYARIHFANIKEVQIEKIIVVK